MTEKLQARTVSNDDALTVKGAFWGVGMLGVVILVIASTVMSTVTRHIERRDKHDIESEKRFDKIDFQFKKYDFQFKKYDYRIDKLDPKVKAIESEASPPPLGGRD